MLYPSPTVCEPYSLRVRVGQLVPAGDAFQISQCGALNLELPGKLTPYLITLPWKGGGAVMARVRNASNVLVD